MSVKKVIRTESTYETEKIRLEASSSGVHVITKISGTVQPMRLSTPEIRDLIDVLQEGLREGLFGEVKTYRSATASEILQRGES